jgi:hypothetical protein
MTVNRVSAVSNPLLAIEDTNLRLAVVDRLMATKQLPEFDNARVIEVLKARGVKVDVV